MIAQPMWTLIVATWREKLSHPIVLILCGILCAVQTISAVTVRAELQDPAPFLALFLAAGAVGRDVSTGVLPLLFTRPLARSTYVLAKWLAVSAMATAVSVVTLVVQAILLARNGAGVPGAEVWATMFDSATTAFGLASVLTFLSVLVPGMADLALWVVLLLLGYVARHFLPVRVALEWKGFLQPSLAWDSVVGSAGAAFALVSYLSTVALCLCLAVLAANRKELSYASG